MRVLLGWKETAKVRNVPKISLGQEEQSWGRWHEPVGERKRNGIGSASSALQFLLSEVRIFQLNVHKQICPGRCICSMERWGGPAVLSLVSCEDDAVIPYEMCADLVQSFPRATGTQTTAKRRRQGDYFQTTEVLPEQFSSSGASRDGRHLCFFRLPFILSCHGTPHPV